MIREALPYRCFPTATHSHQDKAHLSFASEGCLERWSWTSWSGERKNGHICTCSLQPVWLYKILVPDCGESGFWFEDDDILMNCRQRQRNMKCNCDFLTKVQLAILKDRLIFGNGKNPYWFLACCTHWDNSQRPILRSLIEPQSLAHSGLNSKWHVHPQWYYPLAVPSRSLLVPLVLHSLWTQLRVARASVLTTPHHRSVPTLGPSAREKLFTP